MGKLQGYKTFNKDMTNRYGRAFVEGAIYRINVKPVFGNRGVGFHFCRRLEDTLRYFPAMEEEVKIAKVTSLGDSVEAEDEYYGYYEMYSTNAIRIDRILSREEIIGMYLKDPKHQPISRVCRFLQGFKLTDIEIEMFRITYMDNEEVQNAISYYQEGLTDTYEKVYQRGALKQKQK